MRVNLKGIHRITRTLATGERVTYFYAWRGGPRLVGEPGSPEFIRSYDAAQSNRRSPDPSLFRSTIAAYKASRAFTGLRERTRADYSKQIAKIEAAFGDPASRRLGRSARHAGLTEWRRGRPHFLSWVVPTSGQLQNASTGELIR